MWVVAPGLMLLDLSNTMCFRHRSRCRRVAQVHTSHPAHPSSFLNVNFLRTTNIKSCASRRQRIVPVDDEDGTWITQGFCETVSVRRVGHLRSVCPFVWGLSLCGLCGEYNVAGAGQAGEEQSYVFREVFWDRGKQTSRPCHGPCIV